MFGISLNAYTVSAKSLKVHYAVFGQEIKIRRGRSSLTDFLETDLKGQHTFRLFYFVYMWRTLPPLQLHAVVWDLILL